MIGMCILQANKLRRELHDKQRTHIHAEFGKYLRLAKLCRQPIILKHQQAIRGSSTRPNRRDPVDVRKQLVDREGSVDKVEPAH